MHHNNNNNNNDHKSLEPDVNALFRALRMSLRMFKKKILVMNQNHNNYTRSKQ